MKKVLALLVAFVAIFALTGCNQEEPAFKVGEDTGTYAPAELSGYEVEKTVFIQIMGPEEDELFNGEVTVTSSNPTAYEALLAACTGKGIAQSSSADSGWIQSIASYENGTNDRYWIGYINGEGLLVGAGSSQIRNGDYVQFIFEEFTY
ncbi:DUF4430 domain-containing protein [Mycoplasmatota bacterium WC30]